MSARWLVGVCRGHSQSARRRQMYEGPTLDLALPQIICWLPAVPGHGTSTENNSAAPPTLKRSTPYITTDRAYRKWPTLFLAAILLLDNNLRTPIDYFSYLLHRVQVASPQLCKRRKNITWRKGRGRASWVLWWGWLGVGMSCQQSAYKG